jgi:YbbR domain-containing protein
VSWLHKLLFQNFGYKLFALIVSITLYIIISKDPHIRIINIDVKLIYKHPLDLILISGKHPALKVTIEGSDSLLRKVSSRVWHYTLDLHNALSGSMQTEIHTHQLREVFPTDLRIIRIQPYILNLSFAKLIKSSFPVHIQYTGKPLYGYRKLPSKISPSTVNVEGPEHIIQSIKAIPTEPIDLTGMYRKETRHVNLARPHELLRILDPPRIEIKFDFLQIKSRRLFRDVAVAIVNFDHQQLEAKAMPDKIDITLLGPTAQLELLQLNDLNVLLDASKISTPAPGKYQLPLQLKLPDGKYKGVNISEAPKTLGVIISKRSIAEQDDRKAVPKVSKTQKKRKPHIRDTKKTETKEKK